MKKVLKLSLTDITQLDGARTAEKEKIFGIFLKKNQN